MYIIEHATQERNTREVTDTESDRIRRKKTETEKACTEKKNRFECNAFDIFFTGMCLWKIFS